MRLDTCVFLGIGLCSPAACGIGAADEPQRVPIVRVHVADRTDLSHYRDSSGELQPIRTAADWQIRRKQIVENVEQVMGALPRRDEAVSLDLKILDEVHADGVVRRKITFQSEADDRVPAYLMFPASPSDRPRAAVLCLHQTTGVGKDEPAGIRGDPDQKYALELAQRNYIVLVPDYPSLGEHSYDFAAKTTYASGSMKAVWDNIRAVDLLQTLPEVDRDRIGVIGHSLGGHNALFTALFEPRLKVIVSSCGFTTFRKDDLPSWTGPRYMPRIATRFGNDVRRVPFDFPEIVASLAPRPFLACAAEKDDDFDVSGVREALNIALPVYRLHGTADRLVGHFPATKHAFPPEARRTAYEFLDRHLKPAGVK